MELYQLEQFLMAAQYQNITKAAEKLGFTQPALSKNIKMLEQELECDLFDHVGRSIVLNDNGRTLSRYATQIFEILNEAKESLRSSSPKFHHPISVCIHAASNLVPQFLVEYSHSHKEISFSLTQSIQNDNLLLPDFTIDASLSPAESDNTITLVKEQLMVALPVSHKLSNYKMLSLDLLKNEDFVSLKRGFQLAEITEHYCNLYGFSPNIIFDSDNPATLRNIISLGSGIALVPSITWDMDRYENLRLIPIGPLPCIRYINLTWPSARKMTPEKAAFRDYLVEQFHILSKLP